MNALSETQAELVEHMKLHPLPLMRLPGGYWTTTDCQPIPGQHIRTVKTWGTRTVAALVKAGTIKNETSLPFHKGRFKLATT